MGFFDLVLDNIFDMTVVLANGTVAHVSSTSRPDLYWGMKGAEQNFGIVKDADFQVYNIPSLRWLNAKFTFVGWQLDSLFEHINDLDYPKELDEAYTVFEIDPQYSTTNVSYSRCEPRYQEFEHADSYRQPIMLLLLDYAGTPEEAQPLD